MNNMLVVIACLLVVLIGLCIGLLILGIKNRQLLLLSPQARAGKVGEACANSLIGYVLKEGDTLLSNIEIAIDGKETELDNVIINRNGVFIIEVKNYSGKLQGAVDDFEWKKFHYSEAGRRYEKMVRNPVKQVKRQVYLLSQLLQDKGIRVYINGYAYMVRSNSPIRSSYILNNLNDIDRAIHTSGRNSLDEATRDSIIELLG